MTGKTGIRSGSSPLARGTQGRVFRDIVQLRFIPACAGNSCTPSRPDYSSPVHPRLRGELMPLTTEAIPGNGSSPLARGTRDMYESHTDGARFIPACAGNSGTPTPEAAEAAVHPRLRGELT